MKSLSKGPEPAILVRNGPDWTANYVNATTDEERKQRERWRHPQIRQALSAETDSKCAYCEGFIDDVTYAHVEHIIPKALRRDLAHEWTNLTRACPVCNTNKSDYFELLNPYEDPVDNQLLYFGDFVDWRIGDVRAELTIKNIQLNRLDLIKARCSRLIEIRELVERWAAADEPLKTVLENVVFREAMRGEYTATVLAFLHARGFPVKSVAA